MSVARSKMRLPFSFAKRHGVLLLQSDGETAGAVLFKPGIEPSVLMEVRRFVGTAITLKEVDN